VFVDYTYILFDNTNSPLTWTDATAASSDEPESLCNEFVYFFHTGDGTTAIDDSIFTVDLNAKSTVTYSEDFALANAPGTYVVHVDVWHKDHKPDTKQTVIYTVTFIDLCPTATITPSVPVDQSYVLRQLKGGYVFPAFTSDIAYCPFEYTYSVLPASPIIKSVVVDFDGTIDGDAVAPDDYQFTWFNMDVNYAGTYTITVTGTLGVTAPITDTASFELKLIHPCEVATLTADASIFQVVHPRGPAKNIAWTIDTRVTSDIEIGVVCGPIIVEFIKDPATPEVAIDADVFTDTRTGAPSMSFDIETVDFAKVGTYPMLMRAYYQNYPLVVDTDQFNVQIRDPCAPPAWDSSLPTLVDQEYILLAAGKTYSVLSDFTSIQIPSFCPMSLDYIAVKDGDTANPDKFASLITFDGTLDSGATDGVFKFEELVDF